MSRIAKLPVIIPIDVNVNIDKQVVIIKNKENTLTHILNNSVSIKRAGNALIFRPRDGFINGWSQAGTARAIINSMIIGITEGFIKKLQLFGVGYRASIKDNTIILFLGFSHPIYHKLPLEVTAECPSQTEIILKSASKQLVGQVAADLRSYRRPEPYKGKGIRYANEVINIKVAKKK